MRMADPNPNLKAQLLNDLGSSFGTPSEGIGETTVALAPPSIPDHALIRRIGKGSYGEVWLARNALGTMRAVKIVYRGAFDSDRPYEREFAGIRRFEPVSRSHPSQLNVLHVGRDDAAGLFYYVMELGDDLNAECTAQNAEPSNSPSPHLSYAPRTLRSEMQRRGRLPCAECLNIGLALATALDHLHRHGLVHRDIKPSNIVFVNGIPKLADIGLVTHVEATLSFVGTEGYLPPEGPGTPQADIYSLGKVLYEMCTGRDRQDYPELPTNLLETPAAERATLAELNEIVVKACHANIKQRYQTSAELHADLAMLQSGKSVSRMHALGRRLRLARRAGTVTAALAVVIAAGWLWQARQTHLVRQLAQEKSVLLGEKAKLAEDNRGKLVRQRVARAVGLSEQRDYSMAALWLAETLPLVESDTNALRTHRLRLRSVLDHMPPLRQVYRHQAQINQCQFSPDSQCLATASKDGTARVWSFASGEGLSPPLLHATNVEWVSFSTNGQQLATYSSDGQLRLWSATAAWNAIVSLSNVASAKPSAKADKVAIAFTDGRIEVRDHCTGAILGSPFTAQDHPKCLALAPGGDIVALGGADDCLRLFSLTNGQPIEHELNLAEPVLQVRFADDGRRILVLTRTRSLDFGGRFWLWEPATGRCLAGPQAPKSGILTDAQLARSGPWLLVSSDTMISYRLPGAVEVWNAETGAFVRNLALNVSATVVAWSPDGKAVGWATLNGEAHLLDFETGESIVPPLRHGAAIQHLAFSPDGRSVATADASGIAKVWARATPSASYVKVARGKTDPATNPETIGCRMNAKGDRILVATARRMCVWNTTDWTLAAEMAPPEGYEVRSAFWQEARDAFGCVIVGPIRGRVPAHARLAFPETGRIGPPLLREHSNGMPAVTRDGSLLATIEVYTNGGPWFLHVWKTDTGEEIVRPLRLPKFPRIYRWSHDNRLLAFGSNDGTIWILEVRTGREVIPPMKQDEPVVGAEFSPDNLRLVTGSLTQGARIWDVQKGCLLAQPLKHEGFVDAVTWRPDGLDVLTCGHAPAARQWDSFTGQPTVPPLEHASALTWAVYTRDGQFIVTASLDGTARLWSAFTGEPAIVPVMLGERVNHARVDPAGRELIAITRDGALTIVPLRTLDLPAGVIRDYARALTSDELDTFETAQPAEPAMVNESFQRVRAFLPELHGGPL
jgi:WD40 repeat protein